MHLSSQQLNRYRHAGLTPGELLSMDDHLLTCEFCRQQLRPDLSLFAASQHLRAALQTLPQEEHLAPEVRTAFAQDQVDAIERELITSHLQRCPACAAQIEFLRGGKTDVILTWGAIWATVAAFLYERAVLLWSIPLAAILAVVLVAIADSIYLHHQSNSTVPVVAQPNIRPAAPPPLATATPVQSPFAPRPW